MSPFVVRVVLDTNVLVSSLFGEGNVAYQVLSQVVLGHQPLKSTLTERELVRVLGRSRLGKLSLDRRLDSVETNSTVTGRPDPDDDAFLALALDGRADAIVTGDDDLLALSPWRDIPILTPRASFGRTA